MNSSTSNLNPIQSPQGAFLCIEEAALARDGMRRVIAQVERVIVGKRSVVELCAIALLAQGHVLIEDVPGVGKTMLAKAFAKSVGGTFKRIQFTPDLLPGDVTGLSIFSPKTGEFSFVPGPVFCNVLLADEINRATPKTQSALLEAMEEAQVTTDGTTRILQQPFITLATQNPVEYRGTFPLPEAQMDRFLMRVSLGYPSREEEVEMVSRHVMAGATVRSDEHMMGQASSLLESVDAVLTTDVVQNFQAARMRVEVSPLVCRYIVDLAHATRAHVGVALGASPRAILALQRATQASALLDGRNYVSPDDVKKLVPHIWPHRLILLGETGNARAAQEIIHAILNEVAVP
jgi:MoxR-like ATPase